ncbi:hypothetical protein PIB30_106202 [Stylosanthes scabra]|uniref:Uncharacterized protein n=1 Tax=Stylosanthes scabra TaxID=79078 RepID=A0ABU6RYL5_9FABA|nr:hypothetical protein [Stylosanthes scabra]
MRSAVALSFPGKSLVGAHFHEVGTHVLLGFVTQAHKRESVNDVGHDRPAEVALVLPQTHHYPPAVIGLHQMQTDARKDCNYRCARTRQTFVVLGTQGSGLSRNALSQPELSHHPIRWTPLNALK